MSTKFDNEGNVGSEPEYYEFPNGDGEPPDPMLRVSVYFDHPVPVRDGFEDRGGFWASVELRHRDARKLCELYQKGMRVLVRGHIVSEKWTDDSQQERVTFKVRARKPIAIVPHRIESVKLTAKPASPASAS